MKKNIIVLMIVGILLVGFFFAYYFFFPQKKEVSTLEIKQRSDTVEVLPQVLSLADVEKYISEIDFPQALLFYSLKKNDKQLWNDYWVARYEQYKDKISLSERAFTSEMSDTFDDILNKNFSIGDHTVLMDGSIFWASTALPEKLKACQTFYTGGDSDDEITVKNCEALSYIYETILNNNDSCDKIEIDHLKGNCKKLVLIQ